MITQRIHIPGGMYHITQRGNLRKRIFFSDEEKSSFCLLMQKYFAKYNHRVHAFCLMDNHIHLLIQAGPLPFAKALQSITSIHARRLNAKCETTGHRFQARFHASIIDTENYLLTVLKYIHMNPVKANMVQKPIDYYWQTHNCYSLCDDIPWVERNFCLSLFDENLSNAAQKYARFMQYDLTDEEIENIQNPADGYIIGGDNFISQMRIKSEQSYIINNISIEKLIRETCKHFHYPLQSIKRTGNDQFAAMIRGIAGYIIVHYSNISQTELARLTNRTPSSISHSIKTISKKILTDETLKITIDKILNKVTSTA